jgi:anthranilate phosphoribosyltransferase
MGKILSGKNSDSQVSAYLNALHMKGESVSEITGSALAMREQILKVKVEGDVVNTCGTGGNSVRTFNISTIAAIVAAGCGVKIAKQGNLSTMYKTGSADLLKAMGVKIQANVKVVEKCISKVGIGFLFSPLYHNVEKLSVENQNNQALRSLFNLLIPITNPTNAPFQIIGVHKGIYPETLAKALGRLGSRRAMVVHGMDGLDEISTTRSTRIAELRKDGSVTTYLVEPEQFGLPRATMASLRGGDVKTNADITRAILNGDKGSHRDIIVLNAGAILYISGFAREMKSGIEMACEAIDSGKALEKLNLLVQCSGA